MCGLAGFFCFGDSRPSHAEVNYLWNTQMEKGKAAAGYAFHTGEKWKVSKAPIPVDVFTKGMLDLEWDGLLASPMALLHARATTKGHEQNGLNNHPVVAYDWITTHNGTLKNDDELFAHFKDTKRIGEVDTAAINLVLSKAKNWVQGLGALGTLSGTMSLAAAHAGTKGEIMLLARWNGANLSLMWDDQRKIMFWGSVERGLPTNRRLGGLHFIQATPIPDRTGIILSRKHGVQQYYINAATFATKRPPVEVIVYNAGTQVTVPATTSTTPSPERGEVFRSAKIVSMEPEANGIPAPVFAGVTAAWHGSPPGGGPMGNTSFLDTGYGRWCIDLFGVRTFTPHRSVKKYWRSVFGKNYIVLPAVDQVKESLDGLGPVERMFIRDGNRILYGFMCAWCGVQNPHEWWYKNEFLCTWCNVLGLSADEGVGGVLC